MTDNDQLVQWVRGHSVHMDQCCPDFSCCQPELRAPLEEREAFLNGSESERAGMLGLFLQRAIAALSPGTKVYYIHAAKEQK